MKKIELCREKDCNDLQTTSGFCRLHYLRNWRKIKEQECRASGIPLEEYLDLIIKKPQIEIDHPIVPIDFISVHSEIKHRFMIPQ